MKLSNVLASIKDPQAEKTASITPSEAGTTKTAAAAPPASTSERLKQALKEATAAPAAEIKQASAGSPVADLMKTAAQVAGSEHEALVKEANLYGAAVCDGFMARMSQYNEAAEKIGAAQTKVAAAAPVGNFEKFAAENPELVKEAAELGYSTTMGQMTKLAEAAYVKGYNETVGNIYKYACAAFVQGFEDAGTLIAEIRG